MNTEQLEVMRSKAGFIAALDQSGGSTPKALAGYGITEDAWDDEEGMFALVQDMHARIVSSPSFTSDRVIAAILFKETMERQVDGVDTAEYLWSKGVVPFLKIDSGLADEDAGIQLLKPMPELDALLDRAVEKGIFGTKMRSVIKDCGEEGVEAVVAQQFEVARQIMAKGLVPIIEPEVDIHSPRKAELEQLLNSSLMRHLDGLSSDQLVMLKLTLPETADQYLELADHPNVVRMVAMSGGYSLEEANDRLRNNHQMIASYSRALAAELNVNQSDEEFDAALGAAIDSIYDTSINKVEP